MLNSKSYVKFLEEGKFNIRSLKINIEAPESYNSVIIRLYSFFDVTLGYCGVTVI